MGFEFDDFYSSILSIEAPLEALVRQREKKPNEHMKQSGC